MLKTHILKAFSGTLCALFLGIGTLAVPVAAATTDSIMFRQDLIITNKGNQPVTYPAKEYTYELKAVTDKDILAIKPDTVGVAPGVEDALKLETPTIKFAEFACEKGETTKSEDIVISTDIEKFTSAGVYRYELTNVTMSESRYLDVYVINDSNKLCISEYIFYYADTFKSVNEGKSSSFVDADDVILPDNYDIVFRFVDDKGNLLAEDITFIEAVLPTEEMPAEGEGKSFIISGETANESGSNYQKNPAQTGFGSVISYAVVATGSDDAWTLYEENLTRIMGKDYKVLSDEIADHGKTGSWRKAELGQQSIYTVTFKANPKPTPPIPATGEGVARTFVVGVIFLVAAVGIFIPVIITKINSKTKDNKVEGGHKE